MGKKKIISIGMTLLFTLGIPSCSYFTANSIISNFDRSINEEAKKSGANIRDDFSITEVCSLSDVIAEAPSLRPICGELNGYTTLSEWSLIVGAVGLMFMGLVWLAGLVAQNRSMLVAIFKPGLKLTQVVIAFLILGHGFLMVFSIYSFESFWIKRVHFMLIGGLGLATVAAAFSILRSLFENFKNIETKVLGVTLKREEAPIIWKLIDEVSEAAKTTPPDNLIVGMTPNFFVTEAKVRSVGNISQGRTLYLSVPFCRLLDISELKAIIAHELGHFVGHDTKFSRHFYPIYRGAQESLNIISVHSEEKSGLHSFALLPATFLMSYFVNTFEKIESRISRERELVADSLAGKLCGTENIASALVKIHAYSNVWNYTESKMMEALTSGKQIVNSSSYFENIALNLSADFLSKDLGNSHLEHPTDSHPSLNTRLKALGHILNSEMLEKIKTKLQNPASTAIDNLELLEQALSDLEHQKISHQQGILQPVREELTFNLIVLRSMISLMLADGKITNDELHSIKGIYKIVSSSDIPDEELNSEIEKTKNLNEGIHDFIQRAQPLLNPEGKALVVKAMLLIAVADGELHEDEKRLIGKVAEGLKIDEEQFGAILKTTFDKAS